MLTLVGGLTSLMSSKVVLRGRKSLGAAASSRGNIGRPKSWTEFNTRFQTFSNPVDIDLSPDIQKVSNDSIVTGRQPKNYRKVRPLSASFLDSRDNYSPDRSPSSPNYTSLLTPHPWRNNVHSQPSITNVEQLKIDHDLRNLAKTTKNAVKWKENTPGATVVGENSESSDAELKQIIFSSDSDDSAVVVSGECTPYATSSEKSPRWRQADRSPSETRPPGRKGHFTALHIGTAETSDEERHSSPGSSDSSARSAPQIVISGQKKVAGMEFFPDEDVVHFEESPITRFDRRSIVPSPLKSCYSPAATYDDLVEYSDFENSSGEENSTPELPRHNNVTLHGRDGNQTFNDVVLEKQSQKLRVYPFSDDVTNGNTKKYGDVTGDALKTPRDVSKRSSARGRGAPEKKIEDDVDFDEIMRKFKKSKEEHLESLKWIYADSSKKVRDLLEKLKDTMTENGYLEWYPRVR